MWRFPEIGVPLNHAFIDRIFHCEPSILGRPPFGEQWKPLSWREQWQIHYFPDFFSSVRMIRASPASVHKRSGALKHWAMQDILWGSLEYIDYRWWSWLMIIDDMIIFHGNPVLNQAEICGRTRAWNIARVGMILWLSRLHLQRRNPKMTMKSSEPHMTNFNIFEGTVVRL